MILWMTSQNDRPKINLLDSKIFFGLVIKRSTNIKSVSLPQTGTHGNSLLQFLNVFFLIFSLLKVVGTK